MNVSHVLYLTLQEIRTSRSRTWISVAGISIGVGLLCLLLALGLGIRHAVLKHMVRNIPIDMVEVVPKSVSVGLFKINAGAFLGSKPLTASSLATLRKVPGVKEVYPVLKINIPMTARGGGVLFGKILSTDLFMTAVPEALVAADVEEGFQDGPMIPVLISDQLITLYNTAVAPSLNTPQISGETIRNFQFDLSIGESMVFGNTGAWRTGYERAKVLGSSSYAMPLGVTVPLATARRLLKTYGHGEESEEHYSSVYLQASSAEQVPSIVRTITGLGYSVDETAAHTRDTLTLMTFVLSLVGILVLVLASFNVSHMFYALLHEQRKQWAVVCAVGATPSVVLTMVLTHACVLGFAGACIGLVGAYSVSHLIHLVIHTYIPQLAFMPESFFMWSPAVFGAGFLAALSAACLGAFPPAWRAALSPPAKALSEV